MSKTCLNISLDQDLMDFVKGYVQENKTTVADVITQFLLSLKRRVQGDNIENAILNFLYVIDANKNNYYTLIKSIKVVS